MTVQSRSTRQSLESQPFQKSADKLKSYKSRYDAQKPAPYNCQDVGKSEQKQKWKSGDKGQ